MNTMGVCSLQALGDLGEQKWKNWMVIINTKVQLFPGSGQNSENFDQLIEAARTHN